MTDIYLTKAFQTFAGDERISDATIVKAAREMQNQYGFAKNERDNINQDELISWRHLAALYLDYSPFRLYQLVNCGELIRLQL